MYSCLQICYYSERRYKLLLNLDYLMKITMEQLQQFVLNTLEQTGSISDTRTLSDESGKDFKGADGQMAIQSALSSLESRQVS